MNAGVTKDDIRAGARDLALSGSALCLHVSLRSFGGIEGGPATLVDGLLDEGCTVMIPTFANQAYEIPAPIDDRPIRNGIDYDEMDRIERPWPGEGRVYASGDTDVDPWLGATSAYVAARPDRQRGGRVGAWSAIGPDAGRLIVDDPLDVFGPLRALCDVGGSVLMVGLDLNSMTLIHLAESMAGRRSFVRWANGPDRAPLRVLVGECSLGFVNLNPALTRLDHRTSVGASAWRALPARECAETAAAAIRDNPEITHCGRSDCIECEDAIAGGPIPS
jgi:aminoglycoside 3-N-acetyltransferase